MSSIGCQKKSTRMLRRNLGRCLSVVSPSTLTFSIYHPVGMVSLMVVVEVCVDVFVFRHQGEELTEDFIVDIVDLFFFELEKSG